MSIAGKFTRVSKADYRDGYVMVALCGNVYMHDLTTRDIRHIEAFYNMPEDSVVELCEEWPDAIEPWYPAARNNYHNGYVLITAS